MQLIAKLKQEVQAKAQRIRRCDKKEKPVHSNKTQNKTTYIWEQNSKRSKTIHIWKKLSFTGSRYGKKVHCNEKAGCIRREKIKNVN